MNKMILSGNITTDINYATSPNGKSYCKFSFAAKGNYKDKNGQMHVDFFDCIAWGAQAEFLKSYASKGQPATLFGSMKTGQYTDKNNVKHKSYTMEVNEVELGYNKNGGKAKADEDNDESIAPQPVDDSSLPF